MITSKIELEEVCLQLVAKTITKVWYKGTYTVEKEYHSVAEGVFLQFSDSTVFCIYPADELQQKFIHGIYLKPIKNWEKERAYLKNVQEVTSLWKSIREEIEKTSINWEYIINNKFTLGHPKSRTDYPQGLEIHSINGDEVYLQAMKVDTEPLLGYPEITIFFPQKKKKSGEREVMKISFKKIKDTEK